MNHVLPRRRVLGLGASCVTAAALRVFAGPVARAAAAAAPAGAGSPAAQPSEQTLLVARREVAPAGQRLQGIVANQTFPSYELRAREGELLRVTVENELAEPTAVHFHGVVVPNGMDGVAGVTQSPIEPRTKFVYEFPLHEAGTYFYESTWKLQRQLGLVGALVIEARDERHAVDHDEVLLLSDWTNADPARIVPDLRAGVVKDPSAADPERLVNPLPDGKPFPIDVRYNAYLLNGRTHRDAWTKEVKPGQRVRLRIVNASAASFFRFQVEGHAMQVIAADGRAVEPLEVDDLVLATGERYDVLVTVAGEGSYSLRAAALGAPGGAVGVLYTPGVRPVVSTRPPRWGKRALSYGQLRATTDTAFDVAKSESVRLTIAGDQRTFVWSVDGYVHPGEFTVSPAADAAPLVLPRGARIDLEIVNRTDLWQPVHLHGYRFRLLSEAKAAARAPWKDTVAVAPDASRRLELLADQPGRWLATSSNLYRAQSGLGRLLSVG